MEFHALDEVVRGGGGEVGLECSGVQCRVSQLLVGRERGGRRERRTTR